MCWLEDRVFSLTRNGIGESIRQSHSQEFSNDVKDALVKIDVHGSGKNAENHELMKRTESVRKHDLPLRSGFVQSILREVASRVQASGWGNLPDIANRAFPTEGSGCLVQNLDPQPSQAVEDMTHTGHGEGEDQIPDDSDEADKNDLILSKSGMEPEIHKADGKKLMDLTVDEFTDRLCPQTAKLIDPYLNNELHKRRCDISPEQRTQVVRDLTLQLAKRKFPGDEDEGGISGTMAYAKELRETKLDEDLSKSPPKSGFFVTPEEYVLVESALHIYIDNEEWMEECISTHLDKLRAGEPLVNGDQGMPKQPQTQAQPTDATDSPQ